MKSIEFTFNARDFVNIEMFEVLLRDLEIEEKDISRVKEIAVKVICLDVYDEKGEYLPRYSDIPSTNIGQKTKSLPMRE